MVARAVINPRAGGLVRREPADAERRLRAAVEAAGHQLERVEVDTDVGAALERVLSGTVPDALFVMAGDGTVRTIAARLLNGPTALAVVPMGTFNLLARDLDVPEDLDTALTALAYGTPERIDVAWVNDHLFLSACAFGLAADVCAVREGVRDADLFTWPDVAFDVAERLADAKPIAMRVDDGRGLQRWRTLAVFVANGRFVRSGPLLMRRTSLTSGKLALYAQRHPGRWQALLTLLNARLGRFGRNEIIDEDLERLIIRTRPERLVATMDGELTELASPLVFRVQQAALTVLRPNRVPRKA